MHVLAVGWDSNGNGVVEPWESWFAIFVIISIVLAAAVTIIKSGGSLRGTTRRWIKGARERMILRRQIRDGLRHLLGLDGTPGIISELRAICVRLDEGARRFDAQDAHMRRQDGNIKHIAGIVGYELTTNGSQSMKDRSNQASTDLVEMLKKQQKQLDNQEKILGALVRAGLIDPEES